MGRTTDGTNFSLSSFLALPSCVYEPTNVWFVCTLLALGRFLGDL